MKYRKVRSCCETALLNIALAAPPPLLFINEPAGVGECAKNQVIYKNMHIILHNTA